MNGLSADVVVAGLFVVVLLLAVLRWAARNMGGSTPEGDHFMNALASHRSRGITPGGGR